MATAVVNSFNIFIDSGRYTTSQSRGDHIHLPLSDTPISCADNQFLRLTLQDFNMVKNFTNVNKHNSVFEIKSGALSTKTHIPHKNYKNIKDLAEAFRDTFNSTVREFSINHGLSDPGAVNGGGVISPDADSNAYGNSNNIIEFTTTFSHAAPLNLEILFKVEDGDAYELLGGNKITDTNQVEKSVTILYDENDANTIFVKCLYPAQRFTEEHVYIRTDLPSTNLQTMSYSSGNSDNNNNIHIAPSRILGKIPISESICQFHSSTGNEYTLNLKQKNFTMMELHLTGSHGRPLPYDNPEQAVNGNLNFKCTVKVETMQHIGQQNNQLQTERPQKSVPARFGSAPLEYLDYGSPRTNR